MDDGKQFFKAPRYLFRKHNILRLLKQHLEIKTFLDVGCGAGELACTLAQSGLRGIATDFSEDAIAYGKQIRHDRSIPKKQLDFRLGGFEQVGKQRFDLVLCCEVLEHVKDDTAMLRSLIEHSNKYVLVSAPAKQKLFDASDEAVGHFRRYEKRQLQELLKGNGLTIIAFANYGYPYTNIVRLIRKSAFKKKLLRNAQASMENKSKESGINPVKLPGFLQNMNIEPIVKTLLFTSLPFNQFNLAEGYIALCERSAK